jgi:hypothetical protein
MIRFGRVVPPSQLQERRSLQEQRCSSVEENLLSGIVEIKGGSAIR